MKNIRRAFPPPLARAIANSIQNHVDAVVEGVESVWEQGIATAAKKRKADDVELTTESREPEKKARLTSG